MNWSGRKPKLTPQQAAELRRLTAAGMTDRAAAPLFGISKSSVPRYRLGRVKRYATSATPNHI